MESKKQIPARISEITGPEGKKELAAGVPWQAITTENLQEKLKAFEDDYKKLLEECKSTLKRINNAEDKKIGRVKAYWELGDIIFKYIEHSIKNELFLSSVIQHLSRDLGEPTTQLDYCRQFRRLYKSWDEVKPQISWSNYVELFPLPQEIRKKCEQKLVNGEIKSRDELRQYIRHLKEGKNYS